MAMKANGIKNRGNARRCHLPIMGGRGSDGIPGHAVARHKVLLKIIRVHVDKPGEYIIAAPTLHPIRDPAIEAQNAVIF
jgi:hypothetical protein